MKCICLFGDAPLSSNYSGAASRHLQSFLALKKLGLEVHVWRFLSDGVREKVLEHEGNETEHSKEIRAQADSWTDVIYSLPPAYRTWIELLSRAISRPLLLAFPAIGTLSGRFVEFVHEVDPDLIWAESGVAGAVAASLPAPIPFVYSQTDFHYRIFGLRQEARARKPYPSERIQLWAMHRGEMQVIRQAAAIVTGSQTEADELRSVGGRNISVIPTTYEVVALDHPNSQGEWPARILHLGSLRTTSNYLGLMAYLDKVQSRLDANGGRYQLHIIGDVTGAKPELLERLNACKAVLHGHVNDLGSTLRPFDVAIIPYEYDTGTRTKLSLLFNHAQVVVATRSAVAGSRELRPRENCMVLPDLGSFITALPELLSNRELRERIGRAARKTFEKEFTLDAQLPKFAKVVERLAVAKGSW
ncbi:MAG: glycosyltransferase family 4 protein [Anaerolineales bacterium]|nr:glycosyltransferase family 4 protein [Anaerolineales bacterium]